MTSSPGQWPPKTCEMPDLPRLNSKTSLTLLLNRVFAGGGPKDPKSYALVMNFIRVVDVLVTEYESARESLAKFVNTPNDVISPLLVATGSFELCITTMVRAVNLGRRIRRGRRGPTISKKMSVLSDTVWERVNGMRNAIEHIDSELANGSWVPGHKIIYHEDSQAEVIFK